MLRTRCLVRLTNSGDRFTEFQFQALILVLNQIFSDLWRHIRTKKRQNKKKTVISRKRKPKSDPILNIDCLVYIEETCWMIFDYLKTECYKSIKHFELTDWIECLHSYRDVLFELFNLLQIVVMLLVSI